MTRADRKDWTETERQIRNLEGAANAGLLLAMGQIETHRGDIEWSAVFWLFDRLTDYAEELRAAFHGEVAGDTPEPPAQPAAE